jgi:hypothetical protein
MSHRCLSRPAARRCHGEPRMSLIRCTECGNQVSDRAAACPKCGAPTGPATVEASFFSVPQRPQRKTHPVTWAVFFVLVGIVVWSSIKSYHQSQLPPIPVAVQFRPAMLGQGLVLMFENKSGRPMTFLATLERPATGIAKKWELYAGTNGAANISYRDGWIGQHGDRITLENANYQTWNGVIP